jgi:hypothetical protein
MYSFKYDGGNIILAYGGLFKTITRTGRANHLNENITLDPENDIIRFGSVEVSINDIFNTSRFSLLGGTIKEMFQPGVEDNNKNVGLFEYTLTGDLKFDDDESGSFDVTDTTISKYLRKLGGERLDIWVEDHVKVSVPDSSGNSEKKTPAEVVTSLDPDFNAADAWKTTWVDVLALELTTVELVDAADVTAALADYDALSDGAKALLTSEKAHLESLEDYIAELEIADAWKTTWATLLALELTTVGLTHALGITSAIADYDALTDAIKALLVDEIAHLESLEVRVAELQTIADTEAKLVTLNGLYDRVDIGGKAVDIIIDTNSKTITIEEDEDNVYDIAYTVQTSGKLALVKSSPAWNATASIDVENGATAIIVETVSDTSLLGLADNTTINLANRISVGVDGFYFAPITVASEDFVIKGFIDADGTQKFATKARDEREYLFDVVQDPDGTGNSNIYGLTPDATFTPTGETTTAADVLGATQWAEVELIGGGVWKFNSVGPNNINLEPGTEILVAEQNTLLGDWTGCCCWANPSHTCETTARFFEVDGTKYVRLNSSMISGAPTATDDLLDEDDRVLEVETVDSNGVGLGDKDVDAVGVIHLTAAAMAGYGPDSNPPDVDLTDTSLQDLARPMKRNPEFVNRTVPLTFKVVSEDLDNGQFALRAVDNTTYADIDYDGSGGTFDATVEIENDGNHELWKIATITTGDTGNNILGWKDATVVAPDAQTTVEVARTDLASVAPLGEFKAPIPGHFIKMHIAADASARSIVKGAEGFMYWDPARETTTLGDTTETQTDLDAYPYKFAYNLTTTGKLKLVRIENNAATSFKATVQLLQNGIWKFETISSNTLGLTAGSQIEVTLMT